MQDYPIKLRGIPNGIHIFTVINLKLQSDRRQWRRKTIVMKIKLFASLAAVMCAYCVMGADPRPYMDNYTLEDMGIKGPVASLFTRFDEGGFVIERFDRQGRITGRFISAFPMSAVYERFVWSAEGQLESHSRREDRFMDSDPSYIEVMTPRYDGRGRMVSMERNRYYTAGVYDGKEDDDAIFDTGDLPAEYLGETTYTYDLRGNMAGMSMSSVDGYPMAVEYEYDKRDRVAKASMILNNDAAMAESRTYTYDGKGRVKTMLWSVVGEEDVNYSYTYVFDKKENIRLTVRRGPYMPELGQYDDVARITEELLDSYGNPVKEVVSINDEVSSSVERKYVYFED